MSTQTEPRTDQPRPTQPGHPGGGSRANWLLVARREIQVRLTDKTFLTTTGFTLVLLIAVFGLQAFIGSFGNSDYRVATTNEQEAAVVADAQTVLTALDEEATVQAEPVADRAAGEELVRDEGVDGLLVLSQDGTWEFITQGEGDSSLTSALQETVRATVLTQTATELDTTVAELLAGTELATIQLDVNENQVTYFVVSLAFAMLFYFAAIMFGMTIASSVVEEKQSRIVEILAAMIPVRSLLTGKVVGNTVLAFAQLVLLAGVALIGLTFTDVNIMIPGMTEALLWYLPFFVVGFLALACIWAAVGAMASRSEDLQSSTMPLTMALVVVFIVSVSLEGIAAQIASYIPIVSTLMMPGRVLNGEALWFEPIIALLLTLAFTALTIRFGAKLYRRSLLQTQGRLKFTQALKLAD